MAEEQHRIYKLINDKTAVPRLTPIPQLDQSRAEQLERNPLRKFRAQALRLVRRPPAVIPKPQLPHLRENVFLANLRLNLIEEAKPCRGLLPEWEDNILKLLTIDLLARKQYVSSLLGEVKGEYERELRDLRQKLYSGEIAARSVEDKQWRSLEEDFASSYTIHRAFLSKRYFLSHNLIRKIADVTHDHLPRYIISPKHFVQSEQLTGPELEQLMANDVAGCGSIVQNQVYNEIIGFMLRMSGLRYEKNLAKLLHCAESLLIQKIIECMMSGITSFIDLFRNDKEKLYLQFQLSCQDQIEIMPSIEEMHVLCYQTIDRINRELAQNLVPLSEWLEASDSLGYMRIQLPEWFLEESHLLMQQALEHLFEPLVKHNDFIVSHFGFLCSIECRESIDQLIDEDKDFNVYCAEVDKFSKYINEINELCPKEYYNFGVLSQEGAICDLKRCTNQIIDNLVQELVHSHQKLNRSICAEFENLESRALSIPDDTKSLFELTDYVANASKVLIEELEQRVQKSIEMLSSLLEFATITDDHIELNRCTINWLELIKPVFSQHNIFCEAKKGELEDELQRKVNQLNADIDLLFPELAIIDDMDDAARVSEYFEFLNVLTKKIHELQNRISLINFEEKLFKFPETTFPKVDEVRELMVPFCSLVQMIYQWQRDNSIWIDGPFEYLNAEIIDQKTSYYHEKISDMYKSFKVKIKSDLTTTKGFKFTGIVDDPDPLQQPAPLKLCWLTLQDIEQFKRYVPIAICMCNPALEKRHWDEMSTVADINLLPNAGTTLRKIIALDLLKDFEKYEIISIGANKELFLHRKLNVMKKEWDLIDFTIDRLEAGEFPIFVENEQIELQLETHFVDIQKMLGSNFVKSIEKELEKFHQELLRIRDIRELWLHVQNEYQYFQLTFSHDTMRKKLSECTKIFNDVQLTLIEIENSLRSRPTFQNIIKQPGIKEALLELTFMMEKVKMNVRNYFTTIRQEFTRLFFISDREIMKLLFDVNSLTKSSSDLSKCFPGLSYLKISQNFNIHCAFGFGNEEVEIISKIAIHDGSGSVVNWLITLDREIKASVKKSIDASLESVNDDITPKWIADSLGMVSSCVWQIIWTSQLHGCFLLFSVEAMKIFKNKTISLKHKLISYLKSELTKKVRMKISYFIALLIQQEDIMNMLIDKKIYQDTDFDWRSQTRYYYQDEQVFVSIINTQIEYAYEYWSYTQNTLINTPLTDRCYRCFAEAYDQQYFCNTFGLSSTGKTETLKSLALSFAKPFFLFNSGIFEQYEYILNVFKGLVTLNAWVCIKRFQGFQEEIMSVIAQFMSQISDSRNANLQTININNTQLPFNANCYISFTINSDFPNFLRFPSNLREYFRSVSFMWPDEERICNIKLTASGFERTKTLTNYLISTFNMCKNQLDFVSKYHFSLRNLITVIETAAQLKCTYPSVKEEQLLLRSIIDTNMAQLIDTDVIVFENILKFTFPNTELKPTKYNKLINAVEQVCEKLGLVCNDMLKLKIIQLYEIIHIRQSIILVGNPFAGKTKILEILKESLFLIRKSEAEEYTSQIVLETINPRALSPERLYGMLVENEWKDGILTSILRSFVQNYNENVLKWLILDGNFDLFQSENFDPLLDHDRTLFLSSNERICLSKSILLFFETSSLENISPATVSRCSIVYIDKKYPEYKLLYIKSKVYKIKEFQGFEELIINLFEWTIDPCLKFIRHNCTVDFKLSDMHLVTSTFDLFTMYIQSATEEYLAEKKDRDPKDQMINWSQASLIMSTNAGLAGNLDSTSRTKFEVFYISLIMGKIAEHPRPDRLKQFELLLPSDTSLKEYVYIFKGIGSWRSYNDILKCEKIKEDFQFRKIHIPTVENLALTMKIDLHIKYHKPFIIQGPVASGKTSLAKDYFENLSQDKPYETSYINDHHFLTANKAQKLFLSKLNKIKKFYYSLPKNTHCIYFIDDLSNSSVQSANSTTELIRQYLAHNFWYDLSAPEKINISNVMFTGAITIGRQNSNQMCQRFLKHFIIHALPTPNKDSIFRIHSNYLLIEMKKNSFGTDVVGSINNMVNSTIDFYFSLKTDCRPIPSKFLYQFSLHDFYRVMKGCAQIQKESVETKITFVRLWVHEIYRVFGDRMTDNKDDEWMYVKIKECVKTNFKDPYETVFDNLPKIEGRITKESFKDLLFGNCMCSDKSAKKYEDITSVENLKNRISQYLTECNEISGNLLDVVLTRHFIDYLIKICRVLMIPSENLLLVSVNGNGKNSLIRLATYIQGYELFETIGEKFAIDYVDSNWRNDIKTILIECGALKKNYALSIQHRLLNENFLMQDVNDLLKSGEIPLLHNEDELRRIVQQVRLSAQNGDRNLEIEIASVLKYFFHECKQRLHLIIMLNPTEKNFIDLLKKNPCLIDLCTMCCYNYWPKKALEEITVHYMNNMNIENTLRSQIVTVATYLYKNVIKKSIEYYESTNMITYVPPLSFVRLMILYVRIYLKKRREIKIERNRYLTGLDKLEQAAKEVLKMKDTLIKLKPQLEISAQQTESTMKEIESENISVEKATILVKRDEEIANRKAEIAGKLKTECEAELAVAIPILEDALAALNTLKPTDITLVKAMKNPPDNVKLVMAAVCVMLNVPAERVVDPITGKKSMDFWGPSKRVLGDMNFLQTLKDYDKDNISPSIIQTIKKNYVSDKCFMPHIVAKASSAAEGLCKWVRAMVAYDEVAKIVAPKKEKLVAAQKEYDETEAFLNAKRKTLADLNMKLAALKNTLEITLAKRQELEKEVKRCTVKLRKAEGLVASLGGEKTRWLDCENKLAHFYDNSVGDSLVASAFITYLPVFAGSYRNKVINEWKCFLSDTKIPHSSIFELTQFLGDDKKRNVWHVCGLPNSNLSFVNAITMENALLWCLFIDPQDQAKKWLKNVENTNGLKIIKKTSVNYIEIISHCFDTKTPVLLENFDEKLQIEVCEPLIKNRAQLEESWYLNSNLEHPGYEQNFRLYITTNYFIPNFSQDIFNKFTIINFFLSDDALQNHLLDIVIFREKPELQDKFEKINLESLNNKRVLKQQEKTILNTLSTSTSNILEDEAAIKILDTSKLLAIELKNRQESIQTMKDEIESFRETYNQFTKYCADLYNVLNQLSNLNCMYRFSLTWFFQLYMKSIENSSRSIIHDKRIEYLKLSLLQNIYLSVNNALFEKHKIIYTFLLCVRTLIDMEQVSEQEFEIFMNVNNKRENISENEINYGNNASWLPENIWNDIHKISNNLAVFHDLPNSLSVNTTSWKKFCNSSFDECVLPSPWNGKLSSFQKLIIIKLLCPDKLNYRINDLIQMVMGKFFNSMTPSNLTRSFAESNFLTPIIFILPSYSSPKCIIKRFAKLLGYTEKLHILSMGLNHDKIAETYIKQARTYGEWVFLENCNLCSNWLIKLEKICENIDTSNTSANFRLWLTTNVSAEFPIGILQNSIKMIYDEPQSIKQTLSWSYRSDPIKNKEFFESCPGKDKIFSKLLYAFCLLHAVVREKQNFRFQGWNIFYNLDESDLKLSLIQLKNWIKDSEKIPIKALSYFLSECNYGGKIVDIQDKIYLDSLILDYCNYKVISNITYDFDTSHVYRIPKRNEYRDFIKHVQDIPNNPLFYDFNWDKNILISKNENSVTNLLNAFNSLNLKGLLVDSNKDTIILSKTLDFLKIVPENFDVDAVQKKYKIINSNPLNYVLIQEIYSYNKTLDNIRSSLELLYNTFQGYSVITDASQNIADDISNDKVPEKWKIYMIINSKNRLKNFFEDLVVRIKFIKNWIEHGHPKTFWLGGLIHCQKFLSIMKINLAQKKKIPLDLGVFECNINKIGFSTENTFLTEDSFYVNDLYLIGARWDDQSQSLQDSKAKVYFNKMPNVCFTFLPKKFDSTLNTYSCPLYISPIFHNLQNYSETLNDNYIMSINLHTEMNPKIWIKRGTALYCQNE